MKNKTKKIICFGLSLGLLMPALVGAQFNPSGAGSGTGLPDQSITQIIIAAMNYLLMLVGILGVLAFALAGVMFLISAGNEGLITRAKTTMTYAVIGIIVALIGLIAIRFINDVLNANPGA
jgi:cytochrome bd-type quinol oxidase subunit 2